MKKPLLIQTIATLGGGGGEREVARVSKSIKQGGNFDVVVCCVMGRGSFADDVEKAGIEVVVLNEQKKSSLSMMKDLYRFLRQRKPDIVHSHLLRWGPPVARLARVPVVLSTEHGWNPPRGRFGIIFDRTNNLFADRVIGVSEATRLMQIKKWQMPADRVVTIPNAIDTTDFSRPIDEAAKRVELGIKLDSPVIATTGRLVDIKAQHLFIEAAAEVLKAHPEAVFLIIGEGPRRQELENLANDLRLGDHVRFLGFRNDVRELIRIFDIACLSSISEGTPITILEAMACGKPAVVTNVGGCPEVVLDGKTGRVVPPGDSTKLAEAIDYLLANSDVAKKMGEAGREHAETEYSETANLEKLTKLYTSLLS